MSDQKQIILQLNDGGTWGIKQDPYAVIEVATEEDWEYLQGILERNKAKKPLEILSGKYDCPNCKAHLPFGEQVQYKFCIDCGQRLDWTGISAEHGKNN